MSRRRFEELVSQEKAKLAEAMFSIQTGDSHEHARIKGIRTGLDKALELYGQSVKDDNLDQGGI